MLVVANCQRARSLVIAPARRWIAASSPRARALRDRSEPPASRSPGFLRIGFGWRPGFPPRLGVSFARPCASDHNPPESRESSRDLALSVELGHGEDARGRGLTLSASGPVDPG